MWNRCLKAALCAVSLVALWATTPEAQAQRRGNSGWGVGVGPSGVYVGPQSGGWDGRYGGRYDNRYYDGRWNSGYYGRPYDSRWYGDRYGYGDRYAPRTYVPATTYTDSYYPPTQTRSASTAFIRVRVTDPNAEVFFNGAPTQQRGTERVFETPALDASSQNSYTIRCRWTDANGRNMDQTRTVEVQPGQNAVVNFGRGDTY